MTGLVRLMREHGLTRVETRPERGRRWTDQRRAVAVEGLLSNEVDSWMTGINRNVEGRQVRRVLGYYGGAVEYRNRTGDVAAGGYRELLFDAGREDRRPDRSEAEWRDLLSTISRLSLTEGPSLRLAALGFGRDDVASGPCAAIGDVAGAAAGVGVGPAIDAAISHFGGAAGQPGAHRTCPARRRPGSW